MAKSWVNGEFDRQVETLVGLGYPSLIAHGGSSFRRLVEPVRERLQAAASSALLPRDLEQTRERVAFVVVIGRKQVSVTQTMPLTSLGGRAGWVSADTADIDRFEPIDAVEVPDPDAYALIDVSRGEDTLGVRPNDAIVTIIEAGRSPLTVDEGVAFVTHFPDSLEKNHCFQLLASRVGDKRVPGIWISERRPKLGFCWAGNLHTWLGAASCAARV